MKVGRQAVNVHLEPSTLARLEALGARFSLSRGKLLDAAVRTLCNALERKEPVLCAHGGCYLPGRKDLDGCCSQHAPERPPVMCERCGARGVCRCLE